VYKRQILLDGDVVMEQPLLALSDVPESGFLARLWDAFLLWLSALFGDAK